MATALAHRMEFRIADGRPQRMCGPTGALSKRRNDDAVTLYLGTMLANLHRVGPTAAACGVIAFVVLLGIAPFDVRGVSGRLRGYAWGLMLLGGGLSAAAGASAAYVDALCDSGNCGHFTAGPFFGPMVLGGSVFVVGAALRGWDLRRRQ